MAGVAEEEEGLDEGAVEVAGEDSHGEAFSSSPTFPGPMTAAGWDSGTLAITSAAGSRTLATLGEIKTSGTLEEISSVEEAARDSAAMEASEDPRGRDSEAAEVAEEEDEASTDPSTVARVRESGSETRQR